MEEEIKTGSEEAEKDLAGNSTTENVEAEKTAETEELNPYKKQMADLAVENRQKAGALRDERKKSKELEEELANIKADKEAKKDNLTEPKYLSAEEADKLMEDKLRKQRLEDKLSSITSNDDERKLIRHHLEHSIVRSGDLEQDLSMAVAIANKHLVDQAKQQEIERNERESVNARFSAGRSYARTGQPSYMADPIKKEANEILKRLGIRDGEKYL